MDSLLFAFRNIRRKRLRSLLTVAGIAIGVLSVVIVSIIGEVGKSAVNQELDSMGIGGLCLRATEENSDKYFTQSMLQAVSENENVLEVTPLLTKMATIRVCATDSQAVVWGVDDNASKIMSMELLHGRLINSADVRKGARVCIVDESFAMTHYKRTNIVGKSISLSGDSSEQIFTVIGVVRSGGAILQGLMGEVVPSFLYAPYTSLGTLPTGQRVTQIVAKLTDGVDEEEATLSVLRTLDRATGHSGGYRAQNLNQQKDELNGVMDIVALVLSAIGGISLLVAGLSIMTVMLVTVHERTREIGIKKAIGATRRVILFEFLAESAVLSFIGGVSGLLFGIGAGFVGCLLLGLPFSVDAKTLLFCVLFSVIIGILFGVYPAAKAAALSPARSLRSE